MGLRALVCASWLIALLVAPATASEDCGGLGDFCCPGDSCNSADLRCTPDDDCNENLDKSGGGAQGCGSICVPCGGLNEPCCLDGCDNSGLACVDDVCRDCGATGLGAHAPWIFVKPMWQSEQ